MLTFVIFESLVDRNSLSCRKSDISDGTFPFPLFYETSDKFANFIMRNGLVASNIIEKYKVIKLAGEIVSLLHKSNNEIDLWEGENHIPVSLLK